MTTGKFSSEVAEKIGYYVYRLIDPRDGSTFYVGKGKGNRVFAHVTNTWLTQNTPPADEDETMHMQLDDDDISLKRNTIRAILGAKLEVIHVIHRHGMEESVAIEVEAALIDAYPGLTNIQGGTDSFDRGPMNVQQIKDKYEAPVIPGFNPKDRCMIIKIRQQTVNQNSGNVYQAVRAAWRIGDKRLEDLQGADHYVLAVVDGIVKGVYKVEKWSPVEGGRYSFEGTDISGDARSIRDWMGHRIPAKYTQRGCASPVLYTWL